tara:strand:+ start:394 stop:744 length:351 start_codon:yes stop_codon:yes gene_type:complete
MMADNLPTPCGWKILIRKDKPKEKTAGGIILADQSIEAESYMNICAQVVKIGYLCWHDRETGVPWKGPKWAKPGDWVIVPKFTQFKMDIDDKEYRFINDDEIIAVVEDPTVIKVYS